MILLALAFCYPLNHYLTLPRAVQCVAGWRDDGFPRRRVDHSRRGGDDGVLRSYWRS